MNGPLEDNSKRALPAPGLVIRGKLIRGDKGKRWFNVDECASLV